MNITRLVSRYIPLLAMIMMLLAIVPAAFAQTEDTYVVQPGDTLQSIAERYDTSTDAIAARNGIINANYIFPGQELIIPRPGTNVNATVSTYTVQRGDTLRDIAFRYNTTIDALVQANNITASTTIVPGQVLELPAQGGAVIAPGTAAPVVQQPAVVTRTVVNGFYTVQPGDTMFAISRSFNVDVYAIARANGILNLNFIFVGQRLHIPGR